MSDLTENTKTKRYSFSVYDELADKLYHFLDKVEWTYHTDNASLCTVFECTEDDFNILKQMVEASGGVPDFREENTH